MNTVFVSSVVKDFEPYREAAKSAIELMDMKPILAEGLASRAYSSEIACITEVEKSDLIVLILGKKYGFKTSDGLSVTHAEYRAAVEAKKPILVFLMEGELENEQAAFKTEVESYDNGFFRTKFSNPGELKDLIVKAIRNWEAEKQSHNEQAFNERLDQFLSTVIPRNEARAVVAFWGQPTKKLDLDEIESEADKVFSDLCSTGAASMRDGFKLNQGAEILTIESGITELSFHADGLVVLSFSAEPKGSSTSLNYFYISPMIVHSVLLNARVFNRSKISWVMAGLFGMESRYFDELEEGSTSSSFPMGNQPSKYFVNLFSPFTDIKYKDWIETQIKKLRRHYKKG